MVEFKPLGLPLFTLANRPERIARAASCGADAVITDLEDAIPPDQRAAGRNGLAEVLTTCKVPVYLRINGVRKRWLKDDLTLATQACIAGVVRSMADLVAVAERFGVEKPVIS